MNLTQACEYLFQEHKERGTVYVWTKTTYNDAPENLDVARELMLKQRIIYNKGNWDETYLDPEFYDVSTYEEAKEIMQRNSKNIGTSVNNYNFQNVVAVGTGAIVNHTTMNILNQQLPPDTNLNERKANSKN